MCSFGSYNTSEQAVQCAWVQSASVGCVTSDLLLKVLGERIKAFLGKCAFLGWAGLQTTE